MRQTAEKHLSAPTSRRVAVLALALATIIAAMFLIGNALFGSTPELQISHWEMSLDSSRRGPVKFGPLVSQAEVTDRVEFDLLVDRPVFLCVVPFDASGRANPITEGTWIEKKESTLHFPRSKDDAIDYVVDAAGVQAFAVFASNHPVDLEDWNVQLQNIPWATFDWEKPAFWWCTEDRTDCYRQADRGSVSVEQPPPEFKKLRDSLRNIEGVQLVYLCMFPVDEN